MTHILIAAFDRYADAEKVKTELMGKGISNADIQLSASQNPDNVDSSQVDVSADKPDESAIDKIGHFFHTLFGADSANYAGRYPEAARRGSTVVTVSLADEARVAMVEEAMERNGAIDIDERSASWGDDSPITASTETLTTGYPDAASLSTGVNEVDLTTSEDLDKRGDVIPGRAENEHGSTRGNTAGRVRIVMR